MVVMGAGVQVRRGDACGQTRPCIAVEEYVAAAARMAAHVQAQAVFLASDDPDTVLEARPLSRPPVTAVPVPCTPCHGHSVPQ